MRLLKLLSLVVILFAASTADSFAQLTKIWDRSNQNFAFERLSVPGKIAIVSLNGVNQYLIDLTNGETIFSTQYPEIVNFNYWGDRYYVFNITENIIREYDVRTKNLIGEVNCIPHYGDSTSSRYSSGNSLLYFVKYGSNEYLDSVKISTLFQAHSFYIDQHSFDGRFLSLLIYNMSPKYQLEHTQTLIYDKKNKEIVKSFSKNAFFRFFNTKNLMAYAENIQLQGDDKKYSYIRIYDPDKREVIRDIKLSEGVISWFLLKDDDKYFIYRETGSNTNRLYDYINNKKNDYIISNLIGGPMYYNDTLIVTSAFVGYLFDWSTVGVEDTHNPNIANTIYPNPTTNTVNLNIEPHLYHGQWQLADMSGRVVKEGIIPADANLQINIEHLPPQTYYLRLQKDNFTLTYPVVKI